MAKVDTFSCDICGIQKKQTNHWYIVTTSSENQPSKGFFDAREWPDDIQNYPPAWQHACGLDCLTKLLARWTEGLGE